MCGDTSVLTSCGCAVELCDCAYQTTALTIIVYNLVVEMIVKHASQEPALAIVNCREGKAEGIVRDDAVMRLLMKLPAQPSDKLWKLILISGVTMLVV